MTQKELEQKIKRLKPSQILNYMIKGLENPFTQIMMSTYGDVIKHKNRIICFGCAATNAICLLAEIKTERKFAEACDTGLINTSNYNSVLRYFEDAINQLRQGDIFWCNRKLEEYSKYRFPETNIELPYLGDDYTPEQLSLYKEYRKECINKGL